MKYPITISHKIHILKFIPSSNPNTSSISWFIPFYIHVVSLFVRRFWPGQYHKFGSVGVKSRFLIGLGCLQSGAGWGCHEAIAILLNCKHHLNCRSRKYVYIKQSCLIVFVVFLMKIIWISRKFKYFFHAWNNFSTSSIFLSIQKFIYFVFAFVPTKLHFWRP